MDKLKSYILHSKVLSSSSTPPTPPRPLPPPHTPQNSHRLSRAQKAEKRRFHSYSEAAVMCEYVNCLCSIYPSGPLNTKLFSVASEVPELSVSVCTGEISLVCFPCSYTVFLSTCCWLPEK